MRLCIRLKNRAKIKSNKKAALKDPNFDFFPCQGLNFRETNFKARQTFFFSHKANLDRFVGVVFVFRVLLIIRSI